ncbi:MAG: SUMF1/EgtB/PvdO family nonheme iron enzyme [Prevotellaceae bacterium]|nr:SUMF1/EgtB/PvdO family nonheme iron enzyme [Prevotellaceae bacterium]
MKPLLLLLTSVLMFGVALRAQEASPKAVKKIAVLEPTATSGSVTTMQKEIIRGALEEAITNMPGYEAFTRTNIDAIVSEINFQQSGMVDDDQRKRIGVMSGAEYICLSTLTVENDEFYIACSLIEVESGRISHTANELMPVTPRSAVLEGCRKLTQKLIGSAKPAPVVRDNLPELVQITGGIFTMGCQKSECESDEKPAHRVSLDGFRLSKTEVTNGHYITFLNDRNIRANGQYSGNKLLEWTLPEAQVEYVDGMWRVKPGYESYPMVHVTWYGAYEYCSWAGGRLPTEAEWEYAARGGSKGGNTRYAGSNAGDEVMWFAENSGMRTHVVGAKRPNELNLYDMCGNVREWCADWWAPAYPGEEQNNPTGARSGAFRVLRGGGWNYDAQSCRVTFRDYYAPSGSGNNFGFRLWMPAQ